MAALLSGMPFIKSIEDCADFSSTVKPYLDAIISLPSQLTIDDFRGITASSLVRLYEETNPVASAFLFSLALGVVVFFVAEVNRNYSQIDRLWPILPASYTLHFNLWARQHGISSTRLDLLALCTTVWATRLTYNYWRRGGYKVGSEDYRWAIIADKIGGVGMFILDITFISFGQSVLLLLLATPSYIQLLVSRIEPDLKVPDFIFAGIILTLVAVEYTADEQQWRYQTAKHEYQKTAKLPADSKYSQEELDRGFNVSGLWAWSRHPNFACEQAIWIVFYQWAALNSKTPLNWTASGVLGLMGIFFGSTRITEWITAKKYPAYKEYQSLIPMFVPGILGGIWPKREKKD